MQSHWEKLENIRVVDAGYLLAGMEPERKWQYAPPLVANFFNLIREKTGAVKLATLPGERMEITRAEFQALKAEYGVSPATEPAPKEQIDPRKTPEYARAWQSLDAIDEIGKSIRECEAIPATDWGQQERKEQKITALKAKRDALEASVYPIEPQQPAPEQEAAAPEPVMANEIDFTMVATRKELIDAFGKFTDMDMTWFDNLTDSPKLKAARKFTGQGGRNSAEPLFCPYEVMQWLADPKRRKGRQLSDGTAWRLLKGSFRKVYNQYSIGDPNTD